MKVSVEAVRGAYYIFIVTHEVWVRIRVDAGRFVYVGDLGEICVYDHFFACVHIIEPDPPGTATVAGVGEVGFCGIGIALGG